MLPYLGNVLIHFALVLTWKEKEMMFISVFYFGVGGVGLATNGRKMNARKQSISLEESWFYKIIAFVYSRTNRF